MSEHAANSGAWQRAWSFWGQPNPLWVRELRQASRIKRTPFVLMSVTIVAALTMGAVSGMAPAQSSSAEVGDESETNMVIAAPSPAYVLLLPKELTSSVRDYVLVRTAWIAAGWALAGALFFGAALWRPRFGTGNVRFGARFR